MKRMHLLLSLLALSAVTHLFWLGLPREVIFDEVHFGKFITAYCCTHERFFDIHPPHAKLLIAGTSAIFGYDGSGTFKNIGQEYGPVSPVSLRLFPALTGVLLPVVFFVLLTQLGVSEAGAWLGGLALLLDNALTVQTRIIALDGLLLLAILGSLVTFFAAEREGWTRKGRLYYAAAGGLAGLAVGTKFTGLVALGLLGVLAMANYLRAKTYTQTKLYLQAGLLILLSSLVVYTAGWAVHWYMLPLAGSGDAWRVPKWEKPLIDSFITETVAMHKIMFNANYGLEAGHQDASKWWSWPRMETSVFYWTREGASIYFLGNPAVWWGSGGLFALALLASGLYWLKEVWLRKRLLIQEYWVFWLLLLGYALAYVPLMRVPRALFLYHYLTPLIFSLAFGVAWLDKVNFFGSGGVKQQRWWYWSVVGVLVVGFVFFSPVTYGFLLPPEYMSKIFWLSSWR